MHTNLAISPKLLMRVLSEALFWKNKFNITRRLVSYAYDKATAALLYVSKRVMLTRIPTATQLCKQGALQRPRSMQRLCFHSHSDQSRGSCFR